MFNESFIHVAGRHLKDAQILFEQNRFDNTVYLATYTIESTLKLLVDNHIKAGSARHYNHSLIKLHEATSHKLIVLYPKLTEYYRNTMDNLDTRTSIFAI